MGTVFPLYKNDMKMSVGWVWVWIEVGGDGWECVGVCGGGLGFVGVWLGVDGGWLVGVLVCVRVYWAGWEVLKGDGGCEWVLVGGRRWVWVDGVDGGMWGWGVNGVYVGMSRGVLR